VDNTFNRYGVISVAYLHISQSGGAFDGRGGRPSSIEGAPKRKLIISLENILEMNCLVNSGVLLFAKGQK
jgi:hypothetical protein